MNIFSKIICSVITGENYFKQDEWETGSNSSSYRIPLITEHETITDQDRRFQVYQATGISGGFFPYRVDNQFIIDGARSILESNMTYDQKYTALDALDTLKNNHLQCGVNDYTADKVMSDAFETLFYGKNR